MRSIQADLGVNHGRSSLRARETLSRLGRIAGPICGAAFLLSDAVSFVLAFLLAARLDWLIGLSPSPATLNGPLLPLLCQGAAFVVALGYLSYNGHYRERLPFWTQARQAGLASIFGLFSSNFLETLAGERLPVALSITAWLLFPPMMLFFRIVARHLLAAAGLWQLRVVLIGEGAAAQRITEALTAGGRRASYRIAAKMSSAELAGRLSRADCRGLLRRFRAQRFVVAIDSNLQAERAVLRALVRERLPFTIAPQVEGLPILTAGRPIALAEHDAVLIPYSGQTSGAFQRALKIMLDVGIAGTALVALAPLMIVIAVLVRRDGGPAFFAHTRIGTGGKPFPCLKFRSMCVDSKRVLEDLLARDPAAAAEWAATQKLTNDPRVTGIGKFLRKTSLDELPQLINVLKMEMSLVGPRPIVQAEVERYADDIAFYYATRPGLTGLWQVSGRSDTSYDYRVKLDSRYVRNWHIFQDISILARTLPAVLLARGAR